MTTCFADAILAQCFHAYGTRLPLRVKQYPRQGGN